MKIAISQFAAVQIKPHCDLAFDSKAQQIIFDQGQQIGFYTLPDNSTSFVSGIARLPEEEKIEERKVREEQKKQPTVHKFSQNPYHQLRWDCANSSAKVMISPTGLALSTLSLEDEIAVATLSLKFPQELYWEFICPLNCAGIGLGVIREGYHLGQGTATFKKNVNFIEMFEFRTTTPRVIGIKVDLKAGEIKCWLNNIFQPQRTKKLANHSPQTVWYPFAKIKEKGQQLILNPFAIDPEESQLDEKKQGDKSYSIEAITNTMDNIDTILQNIDNEWLFLADVEEKIYPEDKMREVLELPKDIQLKTCISVLTDKIRAFAIQFFSPNEKQLIQKQIQKKKDAVPSVTIYTQDQLSVCIEGIIAFNKTVDKSGIKDNLHKKLYHLIETNIDLFKQELPKQPAKSQLKVELFDLIKTFCSSTKQIESSPQKQSDQQEFNSPVSFHYLPKSDNLLVVNGPHLKLLRRSPFNGRFEFHPYILSNKPKDVSSLVTIQISMELQQLLVQAIDWSSFLEKIEDQSCFENYKDFFQQLTTSKTQSITMALSKINYVISQLLRYCQQMIKEFKQMHACLLNSKLQKQSKEKEDQAIIPDFLMDLGMDMEEEKMQNPEHEQQQVITETKVIPFECPGLHTYYELLEQLLFVDETLYAMCLHSDITPQLSQYLQSGSIRLHTSFSRLSSLLNFPCNGNYSLTELAEIGIFNKGDFILDPRHCLQPEMILADRLPNVTAMQPLSLMLKQMLPENRMLQAQPCANVPLNVTINNLPYQTHYSLKSNDKFVKVLFDDNSNFCATIGSEGSVTIWNVELALLPVYFSNFKKDVQKNLKNDDSDIESPKAMDLFLGGLNIYDEIYAVEDLTKKQPLPKKEEQEPEVVPDQIMVETLYTMGFPLELAKKALIATKNAGVSNAIDALITLQEEEKKTGFKSNETILKPQWSCPQCTFININGTKNCEACDCQAPITAYYTQEELQREETIEMKKAQELKEEKKIQTEPLPLPSPVKTQPEIQEESKAVEPQKFVLLVTFNRQKDTLQDFIKNAEVSNSFFLQSKLSYLSPLVVGLCFQNKYSNWGKSLIRMRRFGYTKEVLSQYFYTQVKQHYLQFLQGNLKDKEFFLSNLMPLFVKYENYQQIAEELFNSDHKFTAEVLEPLFIGRQKNLQQSEFQFPIGFEQHGEIDIEIEMEQILGCNVRQIDKDNAENAKFNVENKNEQKQQNGGEEFFELTVVGLKNNKAVISAYYIKLINNFPYLSNELAQIAKKSETTELPFLNYNSEIELKLHIIQIDGEICIVYQNQLHQISMRKNSFGQSIGGERLNFNVHKVKRISEQKYSLQGSDSAILTILSATTPIYFSPSISPSAQPVEFNFKGSLPKLATLTSGQLKSLRDLIKVQDLSTVGVPAPSHSSLYDPLSCAFTKHTWLLKNNLSKIQLNLNKKTPITSINAEIILERKIIDKALQESEEQKQVEKPQILAEGEVIAQAGLSNFSLLEGAGQQSASNKYLPLQVVRNEGAQYNYNVVQSRLAVPNNDIFVTNYGGSSFTFAHLHEKLMMIDSISIYSTFISAQGGYPIGSGLIFTATQTSYFNLTEQFHKMLPEQYEKWKEKRKQDKHPLNFWEPVGCFNFDEKSEQLTIELDFKRPCRYIYLKPTQMRKVPKNFTKNFWTEPLEIKFFGVKGTVLDEDEGILEDQPYQQEPFFSELAEFLIENKATITVEGNIGTTKDKKWEKLEKLHKIITQEEIITTLPNQQISLKQWTKAGEKFPLTLKLGLVFQDTKLQLNSYTAFRINFNFLSDSAPKNWSFKAISVQLKVAVDTGNLKELEHTNTSILRNNLLDPQQYETFNQGLVNLLCDPQQSLQSRKNIQKLLAELVRQRSEFSQKIYKDLSLSNYLELNLLQETNPKFPEVFSFLKLFTAEPKFAEKILNSLLVILPKLVKREIQCTNFGLKGFFTLLNWCLLVDPAQTFKVILNALHQLTLKVKEIRSTDYNILRTQYDITSLAFEKEIFSEDNLCFVGANSLQDGKKEDKKDILLDLQTTESKRPLKIRFITEQLVAGRNYLIDLLQPTNLTDILLSVEKNQNICKMRICIQVGKKDESNSLGFKFVTIHQQMLSESTWIQLSNYAYDTNNCKFFGNQKLESIGFSNFTPSENSAQSINGIRYLRIQITHTYQPQYKTNAESIPVCNIIPEIFGEQVESKNKGLILQLNQEFEEITNENTTFHSTVQFGQLQKIEKFELKKSATAFFFDNTNYLKRQLAEPVEEKVSEQQKIQNQEVSTITQQLENLQSDLSQRIYQYRASQSQSIEKQEIMFLCQHIEELKLQLLRLNESQGNLFVSENSLDFFYTFALKCSQFLRKIDNDVINQKIKCNYTELLSQNDMRDMALNLFEVFCVHESGTNNPQSLGNEILEFLIDCLINNLMECEWQYFVIKIIQKFLCNAISISSSPVDQIYSHTKVIQALDQISIPNGEVLAYLSFKLGIKINSITNNLEFTKSSIGSPTKLTAEKKRDTDQSLLCNLASILILLNKGYKKMPSEILDPKKILHKGCYCHNCGQNQFIQGVRLKCLNCQNLDCCSSETCQQKHLMNYPNHCFILIEEELPLAPDNLQALGETPNPLGVQFVFDEPKTDMHQVKCDNCEKEIIGSRMMCCNCEDYSLCSECYAKQKHTKYHVFVKLDYKIQVPSNQTPKCLFQVLDPRLYSLKIPTSEKPTMSRQLSRMMKREPQQVIMEEEGQADEETKALDSQQLGWMPASQPPLGLKRSLSHPVKEQTKPRFTAASIISKLHESETQNEELFLQMPRLDHEESLKLAFYVAIWISENSLNFSEIDKINMLSLVLDLIQEIMKRSSMAGICEILKQQSWFMKLFFNVVKLGSSDLLGKFRIFLEAFASPVNEPKFDEKYLETLTTTEKAKAKVEQNAVQETKLLLIYHIQTILNWELDYALAPNYSTYYSQILKDQITPVSWLENVAFILDFLQIATEKIEKDLKEFYKGKKHIQKQQRKQQQPATEETKSQQVSDSKKEEKSEGLQPPGVFRSVSSSISQRLQQMQQGTTGKELEKVVQPEKSTSITLQTALRLIQLLGPSPNRPNSQYTFQNSANLWSLVLKMILKVKVSALIEENVFDHLIEAFLVSSLEIQEIMFPEILKLTQNMVNQANYQKELCGVVLNAIFSLINKNELFAQTDKALADTTATPIKVQQQIALQSEAPATQLDLTTFDPIIFNLLKGWLDILLTKATPKPDNFYTKPLVKAFCKLNPEGVVNLLYNVSVFLKYHLNIGGNEGAELADENLILQLNLADDMLKLLIYSESNSNLLALSELFGKPDKFITQIKPSLRNYIEWYLLNKSNIKGLSPSTTFLNSISESVLKVFQIANDNESIVKHCLEELIHSCQNLDSLIIKLSRSSQLTAYLSMLYNNRVCKILQELFEMWTTSDNLAQHVAFEVKGFEYLLDRMGLSEQDFAPQQLLQEDKQQMMLPEASKNSLLEGTDLIEYIQQIQIIPKDKPNDQQQNQQQDQKGNPGNASFSIEDLKEEEFANKVSLLNQPGQNFSNMTPDWSVNKKGARNRITFFTMTNQYYMEYILVFQLDKVCQMKQFKIGFNSVWTDYSDKVLGLPTSVLLEGGTNDKQFFPLGSLEPINDEGYTSYAVKVYVKNFQKLRFKKPGQSFEEAMKSLQSPPVKYIKLRLRRPIITFIESLSLLSNKNYNSVAVSVSFMSISGIDANKIPINLTTKLLDTQKASALQVLGKLCNQSYTETLNILANKKEVIDKFKNSFDMLSNYLLVQEEWLSPVFLAIAQHNQEMGDWIINKFLDLNKSTQHAKMILEIILSNSEFSYSRIVRLYNFIMTTLSEINNSNKGDFIHKYSSLIAFIDIFSPSVRLSSLDLQQKMEKLVFECNQSMIENIFKAFDNQHNNQTVSKSLTKFLVTLLYMPQPFSLSEDGLIEYCLDYLWNISTNKLYFLELLAPLLAGSSKAAAWMLANNAEKLESILQSLESKLDQITTESIKIIQYQFTLANSVAYRDHNVKKYIVSKEWQIRIYNKLKNENMQSHSLILKITDEGLLQLFVEFIKNTTLGFAEAEQKFAKTLIQDLSLLETKRDMNFVLNLLVPLLNAEIDVPVCLHPYDSQSKRWLTEGCRLAGVTRKQLTTHESTFTTKSISETQKTAFFQTLKQVTTTTGLYSKIQKSAWDLTLTQTEDGQSNILDAMEKKVLKNGPFIILIEGTNSGKNCLTGIFSSQSLSEVLSEDLSYETAYNIPWSEDSFFFYYEDAFTMHFSAPQFSGQNYFGQYHIFEDGGSGVSFFYNGGERIFLSLQGGTTTYVDINLYDMKSLETDGKNFPTEIPADFVFRKAEFWNLKMVPQQLTMLQTGKTTDNSNIFSTIWQQSWFNSNNPLSSYRTSPIYNIPAFISVEKMIQNLFPTAIPIQSHLTKETLKKETIVRDIWEFAEQEPQANHILDIDFDVQQLFESTSSELPGNLNSLLTLEKFEKWKKQAQQPAMSYMPTMNIFEAFEECQGVKQIIEVILKSLTLWKNKDLATRWFTWIKELSSFSRLPHFFGLFIKNKDCIELLFQILAGLPDEEDKEKKAASPSKAGKVEVKKWEEQEQMAIKYSYQILADVFRVDNDSKIRDYALDNQLIERIFERIGVISKEVKRKWVEEIEEEKEEEIKQLDKPKKQESVKKKVVKKQGVGYASDNTGQNQKWNVNEYIELKKSQSDQLRSLIGILQTFLDFKGWTPPAKLKSIICESSFLPLLESALRSGSLLDMSKESDLYLTYLKIMQVMSQHNEIIPCFLELDPHYQPKQSESLVTLLGNLKETAQIFLQCYASQKKDDSMTMQLELANSILTTYKMVDSAIQRLTESDMQEFNIQDVLKLPLSESYKLLLQDLRFGYMSMKDGHDKYKHHYASYLNQNYNPPASKMIRLAQELADLATALPIDHTNSIFIRCDENRVDSMKALVMGAAGTPYGHGAYEYDIYFDDSYPNSPPKVNLETTGGGKVRFNPNLYSCGKVCLSLLGTWRGNATENWDPKLSTLLQVLMSILAIIMSEEVYFNEPGFEGEEGTEEGQRKNEAYSNIVRYSNVKYAMLGQIKNPSKGFETVIKRHFYLKKQEILEECYQWVKFAEAREASYTGLIHDHNSSWCQEFKKDKKRYATMLKEAVKELEDELNKLEPPQAHELKQSMKKIVKKKKKEEVKIEQGAMDLNEIDMSYGTEKQQLKTMDIDSAEVKDRWSRYIGALGIEAVARQAKSKILVVGCGALGVEVAKNIVLSGVKKMVIWDDKKVQHKDLAGQFFLNETDIGDRRDKAALAKIQELNLYVAVEMIQDFKEEEVSQFDLVVVTENDKEEMFNKICREKKVKFVSTSVQGPFAKVFNDLGNDFQVLDKNDIEPVEIMIEQISCEEKGKVKLLQGVKHNLQDGDAVMIYGVEGMDLIDKTKPYKSTVEIEGAKINEITSINGTLHKVTIINVNSFYIGDTTMFTKYSRNGLAKLVKLPMKLQFKSLDEASAVERDVKFDEDLFYHDSCKLENQLFNHIGFEVLTSFRTKFKRNPTAWNITDLKEFLLLAETFYTKHKISEEEKPQLIKLLVQFSFSCDGLFAPLCAFIGGVVSQEVIKAITQKYMPIHQYFYTDCVEVLPELPEKIEEITKEKLEELGVLIDVAKPSRMDGLQQVLSKKVVDKLMAANLFMIGAGAIGCELLKNFAMVGLGTGEKGLITLTDPDHIETSNLSRQFLFREKHITKPKSQTAAAAAIQMNPSLKGHIYARLDKVHAATEHIFSDSFFEKQSVIANALDNLAARLYMDSRCVATKRPLLESGTLGPRGHVQVILPYLTESYGSMKDPEEEGEIPHCTLKMFPEETLHCVEFARDKFGKLFTQRPKQLMRILEDKNFKASSNEEMKALNEAVILLSKKPKDFNDCIEYARNKFSKYFVNDIRQLLYTYPLETKTKEGNLFWSLPKRPPTELNFDWKNELHRQFILAMACLRATIFNLKDVDLQDLRKNKEKQEKWMQIASEIKVVDFIPSKEKAKAITSEVDEEKKEQEEKEENKVNQPEQEQNTENESASQLKKLEQLISSGKPSISAEEFEKDMDTNFHIDFMYSLGNLRACNYQLTPMDWLTVKLKAGRIIPALATTTAVVAGLQTIELVKTIKGVKLQDYKNAFLNLSVNAMQLTEPQGVTKTKVGKKDIEVSLWDRWDLSIPANQKNSISIVKIMAQVKEQFSVVVKDIMCGAKVIYAKGLTDMKTADKPIAQTIEIEKDEKYLDLIITCVNDETDLDKEKPDILKGIPPLRILFVA